MDLEPLGESISPFIMVETTRLDVSFSPLLVSATVAYDIYSAFGITFLELSYLSTPINSSSRFNCACLSLWSSIIFA